MPARVRACVLPVTSARASTDQVVNDTGFSIDGSRLKRFYPGIRSSWCELRLSLFVGLLQPTAGYAQRLDYNPGTVLHRDGRPQPGGA
jgi:hypothetical protein